MNLLSYNFLLYLKVYATTEKYLNFLGAHLLPSDWTTVCDGTENSVHGIGGQLIHAEQRLGTRSRQTRRILDSHADLIVRHL